jgi:hypothetical protein
VGRAGLGDDAVGVEVERDRFDALGAGIDSEEDAHGGDFRNI